MSTSSLPNITVALPSDNEALGQILLEHIVREEQALVSRRARWLIADAYMNGYRVFDLVNGETAKITMRLTARDGKIPLQVGELLAMVNRTVGILASADFRPAVSRDDTSRESIRQRAMAQIVADSMLGAHQIDRIKHSFLFYLSLMGSAGLQVHVNNNPARGLTANLEVIHPSEIFPFPSTGWNYSSINGVMRQRFLPVSVIEDVHGKLNEKARSKVYIFERTIADNSEDVGDTHTNNYVQNTATIPGAQGKATTYQVMKVREYWVRRPDGTCAEYIVASGSHVIHRQMYAEADKAYCPIEIARFMETGRFHGAGLYDLLFSTIREFEKQVEQLIHNVKAMDKFPAVLIPSEMVDHRIASQDKGNGFSYISYKMDPSMAFNNAPPRPIPLSPPTSGELPGRAATFLKGMISDLAPVRDLLSEKGRVDSMSGLQFLDEQSRQPLVVASSSISTCLGNLYKAMVAEGTRLIVTQQGSIPVTRLTLDLMGAVIDEQTGMASFRNNPLPDVDRLRFGTKELMGRSVLARKREALELAQLFPDGRERLLLWGLENGIEWDIDSRQEQAAYASVVGKCIRLYNDGQTPGEIVITPYTELASLQRKILRSVMASERLNTSNASTEVINAFIEYDQTLSTYLGEVLPENVPSPYALPPEGGQMPPGMSPDMMVPPGVPMGR